MRCPKNRARVGALASVLALLSNFVVLSFGYAGSTLDPPDLTTPGQREGVVTSSDGSLKLMANAPPAPAVYGTFKHFGLSISPALQFSTSFRTIRIDYDAQLPPDSAVRIDVRASADRSRWTAWETDLATDATASFAIAARFAQYRVTLLGNGGAGPVVRAISLVPSSGSAVYTTMEDTPQPVAPTFRIHGTREGLVGARTANGHHITAHDHFVSLPSWRSLSSKDGREYLVRITYNGRSSVAPVYDVGPWNIHDNYWDEHRERFGDLPRGWPEDHAAFFDKYNSGRAEKGHVSFPTAIDVGDGAWRDDLGISGDQAVVEVTFLWLGRDPLAAPPPPPPPAPPPAEAAPPPPPAPPPAEAAPPAPPAPPPAPAEAAPAPPAPPPPPAELVVDDYDGAFKPHAPTWYHSPGDCGAGGHALWTYTTPNPAESENTARWQPALPAEGLYDLYVAVPACSNGHPNTGSARYLVQHRDGAQTIAVDQAATAGTWALLGRFPFAAGDAGFVELNDVTADSMHVLWYDAVKWVAVR